MDKTKLIEQQKCLQTELNTVNEEINAFDMNEKAKLYGDKFNCEFCAFNAVSGLSYDGWHNTCGADNCTCCHSKCKKYIPDNEITLFIKQHSNNGKKLLRSEQTNGYGNISEEKYRALDKLGIDIFKQYDEIEIEKIIAILKLIWSL